MIRRKITNKGIKPIQISQYTFEEYYVYGAVSSINGDSFFLDLPEMTTDCFQIFLNEMSKKYINNFNIILIDNAAIHKAKKIKISDNLFLLFIPPYSPELNPVERFWEDVKSKVAGKIYGTLDKLQEATDKILCTYTAEQIKSLTGYEYIVNGL